jgi:transposase-like protein
MNKHERQEPHCPYCHGTSIEEIHIEGYGFEYTCQLCHKSFDEKDVIYK